MVDAGGGARFAPEPLARCVAVGERRDDLEGHRTLETLVARGVHHAHAAFAELPHDRVMPDARGKLRRGLRGLRAGVRRRRWRDSCQPFIERPPPPAACALDGVARHRQLIIPVASALRWKPLWRAPCTTPMWTLPSGG